MAGNGGERPSERGNGNSLPRWFYLLRAIVTLVVGALLVLHETLADVTPPGPLVIVTGLALMGFAPTDFAKWFRSSG